MSAGSRTRGLPLRTFLARTMIVCAVLRGCTMLLVINRKIGLFAFYLGFIVEYE